MSVVSMKELLEAGCHFGHQTKRWNPKMKKYIYGSRNGIYIIDLAKTLKMFENAYEFVRQISSEGKGVMFVGTKKQAQDSVREEAERCSMFFINQRWLGGLLTNYNTIKNRIFRLRELETMKETDSYSSFTKKEIAVLEKERLRLDKFMSGIKDMEGLPGALFIIDTKKERIALSEARKLGIPTVAIVDTNCDPDEVDYVIPCNDDAIRAIRLIAEKIANAVIEGRRELDVKQAEEAEGEDKEAEKAEKEAGEEKPETAAVEADQDKTEKTE